LTVDGSLGVTPQLFLLVRPQPPLWGGIPKPKHHFSPGNRINRGQDLAPRILNRNPSLGRDLLNVLFSDLDLSRYPVTPNMELLGWISIGVYLLIEVFGDLTDLAPNTHWMTISFDPIIGFKILNQLGGWALRQVNEPSPVLINPIQGIQITL
jgi:hypothetical protein